MDNLSVSEPSSPHPRKLMKRRLVACNHDGNSRDWPGLPTDVVLIITNKLKLVEDHVRFAAVCRPWRDLFIQEISSGEKPFYCRLPLLLVAAPPPPQEVDPQHRAIYSLSSGGLHDFRLPVPHAHVCRGSSLGWLITLQTTSPSSCDIRLQNPCLNRTIDLPPPPRTIFELQPNEFLGYGGLSEWKGYNVWKAVLSSDPSLQPDHFVVMAIMGKYRGLAFYKAGNTTWTPIGDNWYSQFMHNTHFTDVIFSYTTKQFYALDAEGQVSTIDFPRDNHIPKLTQVASSPEDLGFMSYLVEDSSSGDLFQVQKNDSKRGNHYTLVFTVFKLNISNQKWTTVDYIGENIMFLGNNGSMLRTTSECPGCEPNCIYYTDDPDIIIRKNFNSCGPPFDGIYNIKDGTIKPHYFSKWPNIVRPQSRSAFAQSTKILPQMIWLEPTLRKCS